jgi:hypothetical protein
MLVSYWGRFLSYDVTDPRYPMLLDSVHAPTVAYRIEVRDTFAFLSVGLNGIQVFSVADPRNLVWLGGWGDNNVKEPGMAIDGNLLYQVATFDGHSSSCGMRIYDISDPLHGQLLGVFDTAYSSPNRLVVRDTIAAVAYRGAGLKLVSVADPAHPYEIAVVGGGCRDVVWHGSLAYVAGGSRLEIVDLADPSWPVVVASLTTRQAGSDVALVRDAVLSLGHGLTVLGDDPTGEFELLGRLEEPLLGVPLSAFDTVAVAPIAGEDSFAVVGVSDPGRPSVLSKVRASFASPKLADTLCYVVTDSDFRVYSLVDPRYPVLLGSVVGSFWSGRINVAGDLALAGTYGISVFDVSYPTRPLWLMDTVWRASCFAAQDTFAYGITVGTLHDTLRVYSIAGGLHVRELGALQVHSHGGSESGSGAIAVRDTLLIAAGETWLAVYSVAEPAQPTCLYQSQTPFPGYSALLLSHDTLYAALGNRGLFRYRLYSVPSGLELEPIGGVEVRPLRVWPSVVNRVLNLAGRDEALLLDVSGRRVLRLKSGANDVRALAPGVYFVREASGVKREASSIHKVVLTK